MSKKETKLSQSPAAISVISQEDIRRSGFTTIPEALRMVPGLNVARVGAHQWGISSRGFNSQYANKLLVLMDGRTVYTPAFGGVYWDIQDTILEDLDRIEVIRGPGATLWGANAVNGVINVLSKNSKETQGTLFSAAVGTEEQPVVNVRHGGVITTNLYYRAYVKYANRDGLVAADGEATSDEWDSIRGGFRTDWEPSSENLFTLQGDLFHVNTRENVVLPQLTPPFSRSVNANQFSAGGNILGRWTHTFSDVSHLSLQTYYDAYRHEDGLTVERRDTADVQLEHRFAIGGLNDVMWGMGYRLTVDKFNQTPLVSWNPASRDLNLYTAFLQDEITLVPERLRLTLGAKVEHNDFTGIEVQPSGRLLWTPTEHQSVWGSISRAVSTPGRFQHDARLNNGAFQPGPFAPIFQPALLGNHHIGPEKLIAYELGYRIEPTRDLSFDIAAFYNSYDNIMATVAGEPQLESTPAPPHMLIPLRWQNGVSGQGYGVEVSARWQATDWWRLTANYSLLKMHLSPDDGIGTSAPQNQFSLRSYVTLPWNLEINTAAYFVDEIEPPHGAGTVMIPAYVRLDAGLIWRPFESLEFGVWGMNLLDDRHPEFVANNTTLRTEVPRGFIGKVTWRF